MIESTVKYFSLNKREDWLNSCIKGLSVGNDHVQIISSTGEREAVNRGVMYTCSLDGRENGMQWHRITMDADIFMDTFIRVSFYASDNPELPFGDEAAYIDEYIKSDQIPFEQKQENLDMLFSETVVNAKDALIKSKGRYLWFRIELIGNQQVSPVLKRLRIYVPGEHVIDYLPEIYRLDITKDDFFYRFMSIFNSFVFDLEHEIYNVSRYFDIETAEKEFLEWLCSWLDIDDVSVWDEEKLRSFLSEAVDIYGCAGTRKGIERLIEMYLGKKPIIIEFFQVRSMVEANIPDNPYKRLYGSNPYRFFILLREEYIADKKRHEALLKLVSENIPAQVEAVLIPLKPYIYLDMHTYLGINSCIGEQTALKLAENKSIPFDAILYD